MAFSKIEYHLEDFQGAELPIDSKELFNRRYSTLQNVIERVLDY